MKRAAVYIIVLSLAVSTAAFSDTRYPEIATYPTGSGVDCLRDGGCHDFNGDGVHDLAVGAPGAGKVYVFFGGGAGIAAFSSRAANSAGVISSSSFSSGSASLTLFCLSAAEASRQRI